MQIHWSLDYARGLGDIHPNRVKIKSADYRDMLPNYSMIYVLGNMDQPWIIQFRG
jgi:hypothetical protein